MLYAGVEVYDGMIVGEPNRDNPLRKSTQQAGRRPTVNLVTLIAGCLRSKYRNPPA